MHPAHRQAAVHRLDKLLRLAVSTEFAAERDSALSMAGKIANQAGIRRLICGQNLYIFERGGIRAVTLQRPNGVLGRRS
jgi:Protein of unknown function (DUF2786)